jgi:hypothetical protein
MGELIDYDRATKKAWHPSCPEQGALPMEGREPGEVVAPKKRGAARRARSTGEIAGPRVVEEHGHADVVTCEHCGGSAAGRPVVHVDCAGRLGEVPF